MQAEGLLREPQRLHDFDKSGEQFDGDQVRRYARAGPLGLFQPLVGAVLLLSNWNSPLNSQLFRKFKQY